MVASAIAVTLIIGLAPASSAQPPIQFAPAVNYPTGSLFGPGPAAVGMVSEDFNGDGYPDIAVCDWVGAGPLVLLNQGDGTFGAPRAIAGAGAVQSLAAADLNGDGVVDLVGQTNLDVVVLLGNGDGTFRVGNRYVFVPNAQLQTIVLDANADGVPDIAGPTPLGIQVLLGRGDGTFTSGPLTLLLGILSSLAPANVDNDGVIDLVVVDATPLVQRVVALRGNGDGTFTQTGSGAVGLGPEAVMGGDFNGDAFTDVATADSFGFTTTVLIANGQGGFTPGGTHRLGGGPVSVAVADFNGDGHADFAVSVVTTAQQEVFAGNGTGSFTPAGRFSVAGFPQTPVAADYDGDGRIDLATGSPGQLSVLRNIS